MSKLFLAFCAASVSIPSMAAAQDGQSAPAPSDADLAAAIANAKAARAEAKVAMERADQALVALEALRSRRAASGTVSSDVSAESTAISRAAGNSVESIDLTPNPLNNLNEFVSAKLGIKRPGQYKSTDVALQSSVQSVEDNFEAKAAWTLRYAPEDEGEVASYYRISVGGFAAKGSDGNFAAIYDFDELASGAGALVGLEYGEYPAFETGARAKIVREGIDAARQACIEDKAFQFSDGNATIDYQRAIQQCSGEKLWEWVKKERQQLTWSEIAAKLYRSDGTLPKWSIGGEVRYGFDKPAYLTPGDLAAITPGTTLAGLTAARTKGDFDPFSAKLSLAVALRQPAEVKESVNILYDLTRAVGLGAVLSFSYRKDYEFTSETEKQAICLSEGGYSRCGTFNIAPPVEIEEVVPGVGLNVLFPPYGFMPKIGVSAKLTYATQTDRWGFELPLYLAADGNGNLTGGLKYFYRSAGTSSNGTPLEAERGVGFFIGTKFDLLSGI